MKQHLGRQSGVEKVEVSLIDGKVDVTPKEDGQIDPVQLLKATFDSGVTAAEMDMTARGQIVKNASGDLALRTTPNQLFVIVPNELSQGLASFANSQVTLTLRGQLYKKPAKKKKTDTASALNLLILEVQKKE